MENANGWKSEDNWKAWVTLSNDADLYQSMLAFFRAGGEPSWEYLSGILPQEPFAGLSVEPAEFDRHLSQIRGQYV